jgi:hypothetical protein
MIVYDWVLFGDEAFGCVLAQPFQDFESGRTRGIIHASREKIGRGFRFEGNCGITTARGYASILPDREHLGIFHADDVVTQVPCLVSKLHRIGNRDYQLELLRPVAASEVGIL